MRQSQLFTKTRKEAPADEVSKSAQFLIRAGYVAKEMAGVYSFLTLGLRTMDKIVDIIRKEMDQIGGIEVALSSLQDPNIWKKTDRWDDQKLDVWFKTKLKNGSEVGLATTNEEAIARLMRDHVDSYRDLPRYVYQFGTKFRNELRAKSGLLRTREFLMKDLYSFTASEKDLDAFYERVAQAYERIWQQVGIGPQTFRTFASGGAFSKYSHEYQTVCATGEDTIYQSKDKKVSINKEVFTDDVLQDLGKQREDFEEVRSIEVGNIFKLGTRFSEPLGLVFTDEAGQSKPVIMGSYGIGPARVMATIVELLADSHGLVWPKAVAPYDVHLVELNPKKDMSVASAAAGLAEELEADGVEVLHDDRELTAGQKFADSDLLGMPTRIIVSDKTLKSKKFEIKDRATGEVKTDSQKAVRAMFA